MLSRYRIKKELSDIKKYKEENNIEEWGAEPVNEDNYYYWEAYVIGPEDTPYEGGKFRIKINFPYDYPENPFKIRFLTKFIILLLVKRGKYTVVIFQISMLIHFQEVGPEILLYIRQ